MYSARITRLTPTAFVFLIDQSGSMEEKVKLGTEVLSKAEAVAIVTNILIKELINRCRRENGVVDYFDIAAIGYSSDQATMLLGNGDSFARPSVLSMQACPRRCFTRERRLPSGKTSIFTEEIKCWIEPKAQGNTPMFSALKQSLHLVEGWCRKRGNSTSYPPTIFNITDGESSDGDYQSLTEVADRIKSLRTSDGNVLLININISTGAAGQRIVFPSSKRELPCSRYAEMLYDMSSPMPEEYTPSILQIRQGEATPPFRGMSFNTSIADLIAMMNIGSISVNKMQ